VRYQLRDEAGASRSVAYLLMGSGPFMFVTGVILPEQRTVPGVLTFVALTFLLTGAGVTMAGQRRELVAEQV